MPTSQEVIQTIVSSTIDNLQTLLKNGVSESKSIPIDCSSIEDYNATDIRESVAFKIEFDKLKKIKGPASYWFEVLSDHDTVSILSSLEEYKLSSTAKATPALRNTKDSLSKILYVGKVKSQLWGRLIQHLGFYKVLAAQGLQLFHWAKKLGLSLQFNYIEFDQELADFLPLIEYAFTKQHHPLIGKHK